MEKKDLRYIAGCVFLSLTALLYCCTFWFSIPLPRYYPLEHVWKWVKEEGVPSQGWYGMQAFAFLGGGLAALAVYLVLKIFVRNRAVKPGTAGLMGAFAILSVVFSLGYALCHEFLKWGVFQAMGF